MDFDYATAFDRNSGFLNEQDQQRLRGSCVAIAGVGGAGGYQAQTLARLGVGAFKLMDPDTYELTNINRQVGASMATIGRRKVEVMREMILAINPTARVEVMAEGFGPQNADAFLEGADIVMDGVDFFQLQAKILLFEKAQARKLTVVTSCPLGFGASLLVFSPHGMGFRQYFDMHEGVPRELLGLYFLAGLSPSMLLMPYINIKKAFDAGKGRGGSVSPGLMLVGALSSTEAVKVLTGKGEVFYAPHIWEIDMFTHRVEMKHFPEGMASAEQRERKRQLMEMFG